MKLRKIMLGIAILLTILFSLQAATAITEDHGNALDTYWGNTVNPVGMLIETNNAANNFTITNITTRHSTQPNILYIKDSSGTILTSTQNHDGSGSARVFYVNYTLNRSTEYRIEARNTGISWNPRYTIAALPTVGTYITWKNASMSGADYAGSIYSAILRIGIIANPFIILNISSYNNTLYNYTIEEYTGLITNVTEHLNTVNVTGTYESNYVYFRWNNNTQLLQHQVSNQSENIIVGTHTPTSNCYATIFTKGTTGLINDVRILAYTSGDTTTDYEPAPVVEGRLTGGNGEAELPLQDGWTYVFETAKGDYETFTYGPYTADCDNEPNLIFNLDTGTELYHSMAPQCAPRAEENMSCNIIYSTNDDDDSCSVTTSWQLSNSSIYTSTTVIPSVAGFTYNYLLPWNYSQYNISLTVNGITHGPYTHNAPSTTTSEDYTGFTSFLQKTTINNHKGLFIILWLLGSLVMYALIEEKHTGQGLYFAGATIAVGGLMAPIMWLFLALPFITKIVIPLYKRMMSGET